ncbi:MAG: bifunctional nicotinamidase/pyrazinamidase [Candidatus Neomarinimicrobiota bacterium]
MSQRALIIVDVQNDFLPGGALPVPDGHKIIPVINRAQEKFDLIVATKDWHPAHHGSFASNYPDRAPGELIDLFGVQQVLWPDHCIQDSPGAEFPERLDTTGIKKIFLKGTHPRVDSYSSFFDNARKNSTGLEQYLKKKKVTTLYFTGLATDYCVKYSVLDAIDLGFRSYLVKNGCKGIDLRPGDVERAEAEMEAAGAGLLRGVDIPG